MFVCLNLSATVLIQHFSLYLQLEFWRELSLTSRLNCQKISIVIVNTYISPSVCFIFLSTSLPTHKVKLAAKRLLYISSRILAILIIIESHALMFVDEIVLYQNVFIWAVSDPNSSLISLYLFEESISYLSVGRLRCFPFLCNPARISTVKNLYPFHVMHVSELCSVSVFCHAFIYLPRI